MAFKNKNIAVTQFTAMACQLWDSDYNNDWVLLILHQISTGCDKQHVEILMQSFPTNLNRELEKTVTANSFGLIFTRVSTRGAEKKDVQSKQHDDSFYCPPSRWSIIRWLRLSVRNSRSSDVGRDVKRGDSKQTVNLTNTHSSWC